MSERTTKRGKASAGERFVCLNCKNTDISYSSRLSLRLHNKNAHPESESLNFKLVRREPEDEVACSNCKQSFDSRGMLVSHRKTCLGDDAVDVSDDENQKDDQSEDDDAEFVGNEQRRSAKKLFEDAPSKLSSAAVIDRSPPLLGQPHYPLFGDAGAGIANDVRPPPPMAVPASNGNNVSNSLKRKQPNEAEAPQRPQVGAKLQRPQRMGERGVHISDHTRILEAMVQITRGDRAAIQRDWDWLEAAGLRTVGDLRQLDKEHALEFYRDTPKNYLIRNALSLIYGEYLNQL